MEAGLFLKALSVVNVLQDSEVDEASKIKIWAVAAGRPHPSRIRQAR